jgi:hypothetical protein
MRKLSALAALVAAAAVAAPVALGGFPAGQCTEWAFLMRPEVVVDALLAKPALRNWNADHWASNAKAAGFSVGTKPAVGAIAVWQAHVDGAGSVGHVAYVEQVRGDGAFYVSEEDFNGSPAVHRRWVEPDGKAQFVYLQPGQRAPTAPLKLSGHLDGFTTTGAFTAADAGATDVQLQLDAPAIVALQIKGPSVDKRVTWTFKSGTWSVGLDKLAGVQSLAAGTYTITAMPYDADIAWRSVNLRLA